MLLRIYDPNHLSLNTDIRGAVLRLGRKGVTLAHEGRHVTDFHNILAVNTPGMGVRNLLPTQPTDLFDSTCQ